MRIARLMIQNGRNHQPSPDVISGLAETLDIAVEDIYAAIAGKLNRFPWEKVDKAKGLGLTP